VVKKALCLSGGATRGSFQMGAIKCLYEVYGFRPDVIAGTSVGAINGIKLACAPPPATNDSAAILSAVAGGMVDPQLMHMRQLEQFWLGTNGRQDFFEVRRPFVGTMVDDALRAGSGGGLPLGTLIDLAAGASFVSFALNNPGVQLLLAIGAAVKLQEIKSLVQSLLVEDAVATLDPVSKKMRAPGNINVGMAGDPPPYANNLYYGTPLYMAVVSLATGKLRYVNHRGEFYERDGTTTVATALSDTDIDAALDENLQPLSQARKDHIKTAVSNYRAAVDRTAALHPDLTSPDTPLTHRIELAGATGREQERGIYWAQAAETQIRGVNIKAVLRDTSGVPDPIKGAIASASLPVLLDPQPIGVEHYCDAGLREIIPIDVVLDKGVTQIVGILCSSLDAPAAGSMANVGVIDVGTRAATEIAIAEVTVGDLAAAARSGIDTRIIDPAVDVHSGFDLIPSLVEIAMHYGWMRAADEMTVVAATSARDDFRRTSELITRLRMRCFELEEWLAQDPLPSVSKTPSNRRAKSCYFELRVNRWAIMHLVTRRTDLGLPPHPAQATWSTDWERDFRGSQALPAPTVWGDLVVRIGDEIISTIELWPPVSVTSFSPDGASLEDAGSGRVYWIVRGAIFEDTSGTPLPDPDAHVVVPRALHQFLPRVPTGTHLMAETQDPATTFIVRGGKRYGPAPPAWIAAAGLAGATTAIVPPRGLMQIPDGGVPSFLGSLAVVDSVLHPLPEVRLDGLEGSGTTADLLLYNRSATAVDDIAVTTTFGQAQGITVDRAPASSLGPQAVDVIRLGVNPTAPGTFTGELLIDNSDPVVPSVHVDVTLVVQPLGEMADLRIAPGQVAITAAVNSSSSAVVTITNVGPRAPERAFVWVEPVDARSGLAVGGPLVGTGGQLPPAAPAPGAALQVAAFFEPTVAGEVSAELVVSASGTTSLNHPYTRTARIPLAGTAVAPAIRLLAREPGPRDFVGAGGGPFHIHVDVPRPWLKVSLGAVQPPVTDATRVYILNLGTFPLEIPMMLGYNVNPVPTQAFPIEIQPGQWAEVHLDLGTFRPMSPGPLNETLRILSNDPVTPEAPVYVAGVVAGVTGELRPEFINFGDVGINAAAPAQPTAFFNKGTVDLHIADLAWNTGDGFALVQPPVLPYVVAAGTSIELDVAFGPVAAAGVYGDYLKLTTKEGVVASLATRATAG
jgi:hypothetical protein